jgi:DNA-binding response OmpR family regulator
MDWDSIMKGGQSMDRKTWSGSKVTAKSCDGFQESAAVVDAWQDDENATIVAAHRPLRVLIVDDNRDLAYMMSVLIEKCGHDVRVTYDGPTALEMAAAFHPDVLFVDIALPKMDGFCVAREVRRSSVVSESLLIAVTGYGDQAHHSLGMKAGFDHYVVKPVAFRTLSELLLLARNRLVRSNEGQDEAREAIHASVN